MGNFIFKKFVKNSEVKILVVGLDAAGKTTLLYRLKLGEVVTTIPTVGFNVECIRHKNVHLTCWDVGLRDKARPLINQYLIGTNGVIFVVDSNDKSRLDEALNDLLLRIVNDKTCAGVPVVVLANKQDLHDTMTPEEVQLAIKKSGFLMNHPWKVFGTSAMKGDGLIDSLDWLTEAVTEHIREQLVHGVKPTSEKEQSHNQNKTNSSYYGRMMNYIKRYFIR